MMNITLNNLFDIFVCFIDVSKCYNLIYRSYICDNCPKAKLIKLSKQVDCIDMNESPFPFKVISDRLVVTLE